METIHSVKNKTGKIITVVGCGGDRDPSKRAPMGTISASLSDFAFFTSDNPRSEDPNAIIKSMTTMLTPENMKKVTLEPDRKAAIERAIQMAQNDGIVLIAGKGHEKYQETQGIKRPFSDSEVALEALKA